MFYFLRIIPSEADCVCGQKKFIPEVKITSEIQFQFQIQIFAASHCWWRDCQRERVPLDGAAEAQVLRDWPDLQVWGLSDK